MDAAAGVAGFIKSVLAIWHKELPPAVHHTNPSAELSDNNKGFYLNNKLKKWLELSNIPSKGKIKSSINFKTFETVYFPMILKITQNNKSIYIIGNYFGGCYRQASLIWSDKYDSSIH